MTDRSEFAAMVRRSEEQIDLAAAALALARIHEPVVNPTRFLRMLDDYAAWLRLRVDVGIDPEQAVRQIGQYLAEEQQFRGNQRDYGDPRNSCLNHVLERRVGIPITLSVIYLEVGWRLGLPLVGVGMPGHFLVKYADDTREIILDPFYGGAIISREECAQRLLQVYGRPVRFEAHFLSSVTRRQILTRILTNLKYLYQRRGEHERLLEVIEYLLLISPWSLDEIRDRGLVYRQLGQVDLAIHDLETYLNYSADASDAGLVQQRLDSLRRRRVP